MAQSYLAYTIFADLDNTVVRDTPQLYGKPAEAVLKAFANLLGREPVEGDRIYGCRIDRIGSEDITEAEKAEAAGPFPIAD